MIANYNNRQAVKAVDFNDEGDAVRFIADIGDLYTLDGTILKHVASDEIALTLNRGASPFVSFDAAEYVEADLGTRVRCSIVPGSPCVLSCANVGPRPGTISSHSRLGDYWILGEEAYGGDSSALITVYIDPVD